MSGPGASETKRKYRRHPKPDEHAPERPPSAYVIFSNKVRDDVKDQNLSFTQIAKLVGDRWQKLDPSGKEPYEAQANAAKEKYNIQLSTYRKTDSFRDYTRYLADFKAKHGGGGGAIEQKRPRLDPASSAGSLSGKSLEQEGDLLVPAQSQGRIRGSSTGSAASIAIPSPASNTGLLSLQNQLAGMIPGSRLPEGSSRSNSPPYQQTNRDFPRLGQFSKQNSLSDEPAKRRESDPLFQAASLSLSTPPSGTPPLPPLGPPSAGSDHSLGQDTSRYRFPASGLQTGSPAGTQMGPPSPAGHAYSQTSHSPPLSDAMWRNRGPELRSYFDIGRSLPPPPAHFTSSTIATPISLPPIAPTSDRIHGVSAQRVLPPPTSSLIPQQQQPPSVAARGMESPYAYRPGLGQGQGSTPKSPLDRSESDAADALAGLAGFPSASTASDSAKRWDAQSGSPRR